MGPMISLTATPEEVAEIIRLARATTGIEEVSEPSALDAGKALNAGLTADDVKTALEIVTLIFKTGTAALAFLTALRAEQRSRRGTARVSEAVSGKALGQIDGHVTDPALTLLVPR